MLCEYGGILKPIEIQTKHVLASPSHEVPNLEQFMRYPEAVTHKRFPMEGCYYDVYVSHPLVGRSTGRIEKRESRVIVMKRGSQDSYPWAIDLWDLDEERATVIRAMDQYIDPTVSFDTS
ncbi:hypothetical protein FIBSPDRAFT_959910 [Athelia psychrophila]|uniref:Uncharacterized protein n=1 Tax=Athelia psychrophila TaxID=1759441 RepID=A0A166D0Q6_9AGAM|nr:hypothetical protein FIBSPDRAFT_959910 [Fibularhizoctonia sp. CBS 109695]